MEFEHWSKSEKAIARRAFEQAYDRECSAIAEEVHRRARKISEPRDVWALHDFLSRRRKEIDQKYDYRYSVLIFVFGRLINEGWLSDECLAGLSDDKLAKIRFMTEAP